MVATLMDPSCLAPRQRDPLVEPRIKRPQLGGGRFATLADGGKAHGLELLEVPRRVRTDARLSQHPDRAPALRLPDGAGGGSVHHRNVSERHQEERAAHREQAEGGRLVVHGVLDGWR